MVKLGEVIRDLREAIPLSQVALAQKAKCSQQTIAKIEKHKVRKPANLPNIAKALGTTTEAILAKVTEDISAQPRPARRAQKSTHKDRSRWPFENINFKLYSNLSPVQKVELENLVFAKLNEFASDAALPVKSRKPRKVDGVPGELQRGSGRATAARLPI